MTFIRELELLEAEHAIKLMALNIIREEIALTNNGKLLINRLNKACRSLVPGLIEDGSLAPATFMEPGDAVKMGNARLDIRPLI